MQTQDEESDEEFYDPVDNMEDLNKLKASNRFSLPTKLEHEEKNKEIGSKAYRNTVSEAPNKFDPKNESDSTFSDKDQKSLQNILDKLDETTTIVYHNGDEMNNEKPKIKHQSEVQGNGSNITENLTGKDACINESSNLFATPNKSERGSNASNSSKKKGIFGVIKNKSIDDLKFGRESLKQHDKSHSDFTSLVCLQYISRESGKTKSEGKPTWVAKFSPDNRLLALGGGDAILKIYQISIKSEEEDDLELGLQFLDTNFISLSKHSHDIIDISWYKDSTRILTSSIDQKVILWNIKSQSVIKIFDHSDIVSCISFHPLVDEFFASGCFDKIIRIWDINESKVVDWVQSNDLITALTFSPDKQHLIVGYFKGVVKVYRADQGKLKFIQDIICKNSFAWGKINKVGKKVTSIVFVEDDEFIVTTNDSRIRLIDFKNFEIKLKYKGHSSAKLHIQVSYNYEKQLILSGSEDGKVYVWNKLFEYIPQINPKFTFEKKNRNHSYEYFKPFPKVNTTCAIWANNEILKEYKHKIAANYKNLYIDSLMILISFDSDIKIVGNVIELE